MWYLLYPSDLNDLGLGTIKIGGSSRYIEDICITY
jgi:hypothetical protein